MEDVSPADRNEEPGTTADDSQPQLGDATATPPDDARERVKRLRQYATFLDDAFRIPGTSRRIGIDPIIGLLPFGGDLSTAALSAVVVVEAWRLNAPEPLLVRMLVNIAVDTLAGSVPLIGDAFDAAWKANVRNVDLLEEWVESGASPETL